MSNTPLTDEAELLVEINPFTCQLVVPSLLARQLETELAEAKKEIERLNDECLELIKDELS